MAEWLAAGTTSANSSTRVTLADGAECTVSLFVTGSGIASIPAEAYVLIVQDQGAANADTVASYVQGTLPDVVLRGPGEFYINRPDLTLIGVTTPVGVNTSATPA